MFGREFGVYVQVVGERVSRKNGFCLAANVTFRDSRIVHPRLEQVSEKVAGDDTKVDESVFNTEDQEYVLHGVDDESETEGVSRRLNAVLIALRVKKDMREHSQCCGSRRGGGLDAET